ncbi:DUF4129 domain-containing protein [Nocardioides zhouii]|uniref:DUF4129 domain-containing protein n=1 Tax=Nocardioides zhouii TaxID=1168729 RepID=A0A4Q2SS74_9ACTN|nr:DUF4129 domain-containing protein [Nocardioides zhouii]RYC07224.1 DUF4129 domain-containing protein [Nocardioides zhouii]
MRALRDVSPAVRAVVAVAATSLFMVLVAWATLIGPDRVFTGPGVVERTLRTAEQTCVPLEVVTTRADGTTETVKPDNPNRLPVCDEAVAEPRATRPTSQDAPPLWIKVLTWTFLVGILAMIVVVIGYVALLVRDQRGTRSRRAAREAVEFTTLDGPARLVEAITADAEKQDDLLREGDPRNAIVAAWQRFEVQGASVGVGRRSWETSSEYAIRILDLVAADSGSVNRLAGLYREARFSDHPLTEEHRTLALEALAGIRRSLGART